MKRLTAFCGSPLPEVLVFEGRFLDTSGNADHLMAFRGFESDLSGEKDLAASAEDGRTAGNLIEFDPVNEHADFDFSAAIKKDGSDCRIKHGREDVLESLGFVDSELGDSEEPTDQAISELSDLTDMDQIETKLDLAKAYFDMDDQESAREILSEILIEGNDEQKTEARALMDLLEHKV